MKNVLLVLLFVLSLAITNSCSTNRSSEVMQTKTTSSEGTPNGTEVVTTKKTVESDDSGSCSGVLSCTVNFVGDVVAFPFRLVGGLIGAIF